MLRMGSLVAKPQPRQPARPDPIAQMTSHRYCLASATAKPAELSNSLDVMSDVERRREMGAELVEVE